MTDTWARPLENLDAFTEAFVPRARASAFHPLPDAERRPVIVDVAPECAPDFTIPLVLSDREQLRSIAEERRGKLPASFPYRKRCAICGDEHAFAVELRPEDLERLRRALSGEASAPEEDASARLPFELGLERSLRPIESSRVETAPKIQDLSDTPLARANRLFHEGRETDDHDRAVAALEEAMSLYDSVPYHDAAVAQVRLALAERLLDRDPERARALIREALPVLTGPSLRAQRERARELEERLAS